MLSLCSKHWKHILDKIAIVKEPRAETTTCTGVQCGKNNFDQSLFPRK